MRCILALLSIPFTIGLAAHVVADEKPNLPPGFAGAGFEAFQRQMAARFDLNRDGRLDDAEKAKAAAEMQKFVAAIDRNGNGKIDPEEAALGKAQLSRTGRGGGTQVGAGGVGLGGAAIAGGEGGAVGGGFGFGRQIPADVMKKYDKNQDGQLNENEQKAAAEALAPKKTRKEKLQELYDRNGDGKITKEEREAVAAERKAEQEALKEKKKADLEARKEKLKADSAVDE